MGSLDKINGLGLGGVGIENVRGQRLDTEKFGVKTNHQNKRHVRQIDEHPVNNGVFNGDTFTVSHKTSKDLQNYIENYLPRDMDESNYSHENDQGQLVVDYDKFKGKTGKTIYDLKSRELGQVNKDVRESGYIGVDLEKEGQFLDVLRRSDFGQRQDLELAKSLGTVDPLGDSANKPPVLA